MTARARLSRLVIEKLDLAFTLGRVFGLLPVLIMSRRITDTTILADQVSAYQVAMFLATLVLYGGPQVYLVKFGVERRVFVFHMALSTIAIACGLLVVMALGWKGGLIMPFLFLIVFRSYYLLLASYLKSEPTPSFILIAIACVTLGIFTITLSYTISSLVAIILTGILLWRLGYGRLRDGQLAIRNYTRILRWNAGYFATFLLQQTYTQITLAVYAFFATGTDYLLATHLVYIYSLSFILHGVLFRFYLSKMSRETNYANLEASFRQSIILSLLLGVVAAVITVAFYPWIEHLLFGKSLLTLSTALLLGLMILLNSTNFGWSALFMSTKRPYHLAAVAVVSTAVVVVGIVTAAAFDIKDGLVYSMVIGLLIQALLRGALGLRLLRALQTTP